MQFSFKRGEGRRMGDTPDKLERHREHWSPICPSGTQIQAANLREFMAEFWRRLSGQHGIWIGKLADGTTSPSAAKLTIADTAVKFETGTTSEMRYTVNSSAVAKLDVSVPVYGAIKGSVTSDSLHELKFSYATGKYKNSEISADLPAKLSADQRRQVRALLTKITDAKVIYIDSAEMVVQFAWSSTKGQKVESALGLNAVTVVAVDGKYAFSEQDSKVFSIADAVIKVKFASLDALAVLAWLDASENKEKPSIAPIPTLIDDGKPGFDRVYKSFRSTQ